MQTSTASRQIYAADDAPARFVGVYFISSADWRVRIRITGSRPEAMDAFVRAQPWGSLGGH